MALGVRADELEMVHAQALSWEDYLATDPEKAAGWRELESNFSLLPEQEHLLSLFSRQMRVLVISGIWCGDCVRQGPVLHRIAEASGCIDLKFIDRDACPDLCRQVMINDGMRVPVVLFLAEDYKPVSVAGDRTLSYYRHIAEQKLGASCPVPGAPAGEDLLAGLAADWIDEFERVHLLLRLSGRLRAIHGD